MGSPADAARAMSAAVRMNPYEADYHYLLGIAYVWMGNAPDGIAPLQRATELQPDRAAFHLALGMVQNSQKRFAEARQALERCLALSPGQPSALYLLAEAAQGENELDRAEGLARRVLESEARHAGANLVLGTVLLKRGVLEGARQALEIAAQADPSSARTHYQLSLVYARLKDDARAQQALAAYQKARQENIQSMESLRQLLNFSQSDARRGNP
ncbi:MAG: tetratricopeptide repeat protein [Terriglobales bacterium]